MNTRSRIMLTIAAIIIVLAVAMAVIGVYVIKPTYYSSPGYGYGMMFGGYYGYWYVLMPIMAAAALVVFFLFLYMIGVFGRRDEEGKKYSATDILQQKLARGEISEEEYERKKKLIG